MVSAKNTWELTATVYEEVTMCRFSWKYIQQEERIRSSFESSFSSSLKWWPSKRCVYFYFAVGDTDLTAAGAKQVTLSSTSKSFSRNKVIQQLSSWVAYGQPCPFPGPDCLICKEGMRWGSPRLLLALHEIQREAHSSLGSLEIVIWTGTDFFPISFI